MQVLELNTAVTVALGLAVDWQDGKTLLTETPALTDLACTLYKNGVAETKTLAGALTVDAHGMILLDLTAADTDTAGRLTAVVTNAVIEGFSTDVILPRIAEFSVLTAADYAAWWTGGDVESLLPDADAAMTMLQRAAVEQLQVFGEPVVYHPHDDVAQTIAAVVTRGGPAGLGAAPGRAEQITVSVLNTDTGGIATDAVDTGKDAVTVAARLGDTPRKRRLLRLIHQDAGMATYEVQ